MKTFVLAASLFLLATMPVSDSGREEIALKFCKDVWVSHKSDDQIIRQYLVKNTNKEIADSSRISLIKLYLNYLREVKLSGSLSDLKVEPYSQVTPIRGLNLESNKNDVFAITERDKVLFYALFEKDRIASFTILKKGQKSYFLKF